MGLKKNILTKNTWFFTFMEIFVNNLKLKTSNWKGEGKVALKALEFVLKKRITNSATQRLNISHNL